MAGISCCTRALIFSLITKKAFRCIGREDFEQVTYSLTKEDLLCLFEQAGMHVLAVQGEGRCGRLAVCRLHLWAVPEALGLTKGRWRYYANL